MEMWQVYLLLKLDTFRAVAEPVIFLSAFLSAFYLFIVIATAVEDIEIPTVGKVIGNTNLVITMLSIATLLFLPSTKEAATIWLVPKIVNSSVVQKDVPELYNMGKNALKEDVPELYNLGMAAIKEQLSKLSEEVQTVEKVENKGN